MYANGEGKQNVEGTELTSMCVRHLERCHGILSKLAVTVIKPHGDVVCRVRVGCRSLIDRDCFRRRFVSISYLVGMLVVGSYDTDQSGILRWRDRTSADGVRIPTTLVSILIKIGFCAVQLQSLFHRSEPRWLAGVAPTLAWTVATN